MFSAGEIFCTKTEGEKLPSCHHGVCTEALPGATVGWHVE